MNLDINVSDNDSTAVVTLAGEIDAYTAPQLKEQLLPLTKVSGKVVEVNLENVNYMDSTGLGVFVSALKSTKENNSELKLVQLQNRVMRLFEITGLTDIINIDSTVRGGS
ncbi:anti-sigma factor antagonist [Sediminibacillus dalangtanensis]|uniref:Anti-sigma factor antagonist n=1 Tax=Sediminibacillus dalangtanensis TaxID=2729421 RepID=A0ABX7VMU3_9BACI|nr:STAS domain-containing protein [Sediminibacillus dalangtanensis]QTM98132.1 anti-sigma factor antagonist [Sediminibacillus dalangtanensis]